MEDFFITEKRKCVACGVCKGICPVGAINYIEDEDGFFYPNINKNICINCGKCKSVCIRNKDVVREDDYIDAFYGYCTSEKSFDYQSGGFCSLLSSYIINKGGCVFGVGYNDDYTRCEYYKIKDLTSLQKIQGVKYIQSFPIDYKDLVNELRSNKIVLLIGLPCLVSAIIDSFDKKYDNLLSVSLICHGPTSNLVHNKWIKDNDFGSIKSFNVKKKVKNRYAGYTIVKGERNNCFIPWIKTDYCRLFNIILRESCYNCEFKLYKNKSDIIAGDFWPDKIRIPHNRYGNSAIIVKKNNKIWLDILKKLDDFEFYRISLDEIVNQNPALVKVAQTNPLRDEILIKLKKDIPIYNTIRVSKMNKLKYTIRTFFSVYIPSGVQIFIKRTIKIFKNR